MTAALLYAGADVQAPDYFIALKTGKRYFVEVKHAGSDSLKATVSFSKNYLARLKRYAYLKGQALRLGLLMGTVYSGGCFAQPS